MNSKKIWRWLNVLSVVSLAAYAGDEAGRKSTGPDGMALIPAGVYLMGSVRNASDELPFRRVFISDLLVDRYETTNFEYNEFLKAKYPAEPENMGPENFPVMVSWPRANEYCAFRDKRLMTEAEWEKVAKGGVNARYATSTGELSNDLARIGDHYSGPTAVGSFPPNPYGVYDLVGNVSEWTADWYHNRSYTDCFGGTWNSIEDRKVCMNPAGLTLKDKLMKEWRWPTRVHRGIYWGRAGAGDDATAMVYMTSYRGNYVPDIADRNPKYNIVGIRCAKLAH